MTDRAWKASERRMAEVLSLGGRLDVERVGVPGRQRGHSPDLKHPMFAVEHKYGLHAISALQREAWEQADASAAVQGLPPLVTLEQRYGRGKPLERYVMMRAEDFADLLRFTLEGPGGVFDHLLNG